MKGRKQEPEPTPSGSVRHEAGDRFAALLPVWVPAAERTVHEGDRDAEFDWYDDASTEYRTLSVSVSPEGVIYYAALLADEDVRAHGKGHLRDGVPSEVLDMLRTLFPTAEHPERALVLASDPSRSTPHALSPSAVSTSLATPRTETPAP
jgi:hypothetical protein